MIEFESSSPERDPSEPHPIETESYRILRSRVDLSHLPPLTRAVTERVIHASADFDYVTDLVADEAALAAGVAAIRRGAPVVADVAMVASGITGYPVICKIGEGLATRLARTVGHHRVRRRGPAGVRGGRPGRGLGHRLCPDRAGRDPAAGGRPRR